MQYLATIFSILIILSINQYSNAQDLPTLDWDALQKTKPWEDTEIWEPVPKKVNPAGKNNAPSDAVILFKTLPILNHLKI